MRLGQRQDDGWRQQQQQQQTLPHDVSTTISGDFHSSLQLMQAGVLANNVFFQMIRESPVHVIRNKSLPASHLTPSLIAAFLSHSMSGDFNPSHVIKDILRRDFGVRSNHIYGNQKTGISIARWMDLLPVTAPHGENGSTRHPSLQSLISSIWLVALWGVATSKQDLEEYFLAIQRYDNTIPDLSEYQHEGDFVESDFTAEHLEGALDRLIHYYSQPCSRDDYHRERGQDADSTLAARSLELLCAFVALQQQQSAMPPTLPNGYYTYDGGEIKADCVEVTIREIFFLLLWDDKEGRLDFSRLPDTTSHLLKDLLTVESNHLDKQNSLAHVDFGKAWFDLLSDRNQCIYLAKSVSGLPFELAPTLEGISKVLWSLLVAGENPNIQEKPWKSLNDLVKFWNQHNPGRRLYVQHDVLRHAYSNAAADGTIIEHEVARLQLQESQQAMEIRLRCDWTEACGMAAVTRLVERRQDVSLNSDQIRTLHGVNRNSSTNNLRASHEPSLAMMCMALPQDNDLSASPFPQSILQMLTTPYGPDRRAAHINCVEKDPQHQLEADDMQRQSQQVLKEAILGACYLCETRPVLGQRLLRWTLQESPVVVEASQPSQRIEQDSEVESALLALPSIILDNEFLLEAIERNWAVRGRPLAMLVRWRNGKASLMDFMFGLKSSEWRGLMQLSQLNATRGTKSR